MGFDTETDLAVEAVQCGDPDQMRADISDLRASLVSEHLGVSKAELADALTASRGSLIGAITALKGDGRSLRLFEEADINGEANILAENEFADPEEVGDGLAERLVHGVRDLVGNASE